MMTAFITETWGNFPSEVIVTCGTLLIYLLHHMDKRIERKERQEEERKTRQRERSTVSPVELIRTEQKWERLVNWKAEKLREEFEEKLSERIDDLRHELGG